MADSRKHDKDPIDATGLKKFQFNTEFYQAEDLFGKGRLVAAMRGFANALNIAKELNDPNLKCDAYIGLGKTSNAYGASQTHKSEKKRYSEAAQSFYQSAHMESEKRYAEIFNSGTVMIPKTPPPIVKILGDINIKDDYLEKSDLPGPKR